MGKLPETYEQHDQPTAHHRLDVAARPGLVRIFTAGQPALDVFDLSDAGLVIGRDEAGSNSFPSDRCMSREHARIFYSGQRFWVTDLGSRNGTNVDGQRVRASFRQPANSVIRMGESLFLPVLDVRPFKESRVMVQQGRVLGPKMQAILADVGRAARLGTTLFIGGESGSGKEGTARAFHTAATNTADRFIAVNCAAIPEGVAERLLFGTRRGAFSGADADADGYVQSADGGTLFLDEVAELSTAVQAKLLRVLETREVLPLGASRPRLVNIRICSATHKDLRALVASGRLREDLYFRIAHPQVTVPPLRQRLEEIPWLLQGELDRTAPGLKLHASLVEACLLRTWPGNVRELLLAARFAMQAVLGSGEGHVEAQHLSDVAGMEFTASATPKAPRPRATPPQRVLLEEVLRRERGNVSAAARSLGVHRTQLRRWLVSHWLTAADFAR